MPIQSSEESDGKILVVRVNGKLAKADYGLFSTPDGMRKMVSGQPLESPWIVAGVLALGSAAGLVSLWKRLVQVEVPLEGNVSAPAMIAAINDCERAVCAAFPEVRWLFFEPGVEP